MVSPQHEEILRVFDLIGEHQANALDGLFSPIDVIPQEQVVRISRESSILEQLDQVRILPMHIP